MGGLPRRRGRVWQSSLTPARRARPAKPDKRVTYPCKRDPPPLTGETDTRGAWCSIRIPALLSEAVSVPAAVAAVRSAGRQTASARGRHRCNDASTRVAEKPTAAGGDTGRRLGHSSAQRDIQVENGSRVSTVEVHGGGWLSAASRGQAAHVGMCGLECAAAGSRRSAPVVRQLGPPRDEIASSSVSASRNSEAVDAALAGPNDAGHGSDDFAGVLALRLLRRVHAPGPAPGRGPDVRLPGGLEVRARVPGAGHAVPGVLQEPAALDGGSESRRRLRVRPARPAPHVGPAST